MPIFVSILLAFIPAMIYAWITYWMDRYEKEPLHLLGGVFIWGAVIAAGGSYILNTIFGIAIYSFTSDTAIADIATGSVSAPLVEEALKGFAVLVVFLVFRQEFDTILDGIVYAAITALGFAATENVLYMMQFGYAEDGWAGLWSIFFLRVVLGAWNHASYTAFSGIGLAIARNNKKPLVRIGAPLGGFAAAIFTHFIHNTIGVVAGNAGGLLMMFVVDWLGWLFIFGIMLWAIRRERMWIQFHLKQEVADGLISQEQYDVAVSAFRRGLAAISGLGSSGFRATRRFYQLTAELAYKKQQIARVGTAPGNSLEMIDKLRAEIGRLAPQANV
jgi:RsiW-degrading membrane proteinase PrsW (M82 family)